MRSTVRQVSIGRGVISMVGPGGVVRTSSEFSNILVYSGIDLLGKILGGRDYRVNMMYIEFNNGGPLSVTPDPAEGRSYYADLETDGNPDHGYLRIPLVAQPDLLTSDPSKFESNRVMFYSMTSGTIGLRGASDFSSSVSSVVFGVALVAAPDAGDPSQDIVFSRSYDFTPKVKLTNEEVAIAWSHTFPEELIPSSSSSSL